MKKIDLTCGYKIERLLKENNNIVARLCEKCSDYYMLSGGDLPSKEDIDTMFTDLPPNKNLEDKFLLGVYESDELVGMVDIIKNFPTIGEWSLGLMLIDPDKRGSGLGEIIHKTLIGWAKDLGAKTFRIGVIENNQKAFKFWSNLGYTKIKEVKMDFKSKTHVVNIMRLQV
jgi:RimJ/RimL family protein N-acetyltransferase